MSRESWYRSAGYNVIGFLPPTPGAKLVSGLQEIVREEGQKISLNIRLMEQSGTSISSLLTSPDLSGCLHPRCDISKEGASHSRRGANYTGTCLICGNIYHGETRFGAHTHVTQHKEDIRRNNYNNSMAVHLAEHHPDSRGDPETIVFFSNKYWSKTAYSSNQRSCENYQHNSYSSHEHKSRIYSTSHPKDNSYRPYH